MQNHETECNFTLVDDSFAAERLRRLQLNQIYRTLYDLIPNPNPLKRDRCSVVGYAIAYIKELKSNVEKLKDKKRAAQEKNKRQKACGDGAERPPHQCCDPSTGDSCELKSKDKDVCAQISNGELTVKVIQRNRENVLLFVAKVLDELRLEEPHCVSGAISEGEHDHTITSTFNFCIKIQEGCLVHACAVAARLIDVEAGVAPPSPRCKL